MTTTLAADTAAHDSAFPSDDTASALRIAHDLVKIGVPIFVAQPDPSAATGFTLPYSWQSTAADPNVVSLWRPGMALCAVMGHGLDLIDVDPRNGGSLDSVPLPVVYGVASTPSEGVHAFVGSLGVRSRNNVLPGVDIKAGDSEGKGRGFAFIAPTQRVSKVDGRLRSYRWLQAPLFPRCPACAQMYAWYAERARDYIPEGHECGIPASDSSGLDLARMVRAAQGVVSVIPGDDPEKVATAPSIDRFLSVGPWVDVERTLAGGRNDGVMRLAAALRGEGGMTVDRALDYMRVTVWPLIDQTQAGHEFGVDEFDGIVRGVWERYPDGRVARLDETVDSSAERPPALGGVGLLDAWFVDRVASARLAGRYLWARGLGWLEWDLRRWACVDASVVVDDVRQYIQWLYSSAAAAGADSDLLKRIAGLGARSRLGGLVELCRGVAGVRAGVSEFDAHPDLLNCANGVVDLRTGELLAHDPSLRLTRLTPVDYVAGAEHGDWKAALEAVPAGVRGWWQLRIGQAATGHMTPDDLLVVQVGGGENGKTTLMAGIRGALGEYYLLVSHRALLGNSDSVPTELMDFRGARLALLEETPEERRLAVTKLKALVGTPEITARRMRQDPVTFAASHSLFVSTNYLPVISESDHGTWRRLACMTFPYRWIPSDAQMKNKNDRVGDPGLRDRLITGAHGQHEAVLAWIVAGAVRWYTAGKEMPQIPRDIRASTWEWRASSDLVLCYIAERLAFDATSHIAARDLSDDVNEWLVSRGHRPWSAELVASRFGGHSEFAAHDVEKKLIRARPGRSCRPARTGMVTDSHNQERYHAWLGVKFSSFDYVEFVSQNDNDDGVSSHNVGIVSPISGDPTPPKRVNKRSPTSSVTSGTNNPVPPEISISLISGVNGLGCDTRDKDQLEDQQGSSQKVAVDNLSSRLEVAPSSLVATTTAVASRPIAKISKAEATRRARAQAVVDAAGPLRTLPVLVDRSGQIMERRGPIVLAELVRAIDTALTVDVETTGYPIGHADYALRTIQLGDSHGAMVLDASDPEQSALARTALAAATRLHAHSATADLAPLANAGLIDYDEAWSRMWDTVIPAKLADPQSTGSDPALKKLAEVVLGEDAVSPKANEARADLFSKAKWLTDTKITTPIERSGWAQVDPGCATMSRYAAADVLDDAELAIRLPDPPADVWDRERTAQRVTARVAYRGLCLDSDRVAELLAEHTNARAVAGQHVTEFGGVTNPGSDTQVAAALSQMGAELPRTATGRLSVAADAIEPLRRSEGQIGDLVRARLEYQHHDKLISSFLEPYSQLIHRGDGRVRPTVYTLGADTGRMSCVRPNLQQVPRVGGVRGCITASPGHVLISADFASVEIRVMAALSQDPSLMYALAHGVDVHGQIAAQVFGPDFTKSDRYTVKRGVFGWAYGGGATNLAKQIGVSESVMSSVIEVLADLAPTYVQWSQWVKEQVKAGHTQFPTYAGRVIHLAAGYPHKAPNYCVQGTARELLVDALILWDKTEWGNCTVLPVHDEIVAEVPEQDAEKATRVLVACMERDLMGVAIKAEAGEPSFSWRDAA